MTPVDISIFQVLALVLTGSFTYLIYLFRRFVTGLETRHQQNQLKDPVNPVLTDLQIGAVQLGLPGERAKYGSMVQADIHGPLHTNDGFLRQGREGGLGSTGPVRHN